MQQPISFIPKQGSTAMSNTERQRQFRLRNPDYYRRLQAKRRGCPKARRLAAMRAIAEVMAKVEQQEREKALVAKPMLCLPAPAVVFPVLPTREEIAARAEQRETQHVTAG